MGETTARRAFHTFCENFVGEFYSTYVNRPTGEKLYKVMKVFELMGLPGCIGSTDCVHLKWCDPHTRTGCMGTGVRSDRIEDDPIHPIHCHDTCCVYL